MRTFQRRLLIFLVIVLSFLSLAMVCTSRHFGLPIPLTGEYSGQTVTAVQVQDGVTATATAKTYGWEICYPAFVDVEVDWAWQATVVEDREGHFAIAWVAGGGQYLMGGEAAMGCFWAHKIKFGAYHNDLPGHILCVELYTGDPLPCMP